MKKIETACVDCGLPCIGYACRYKAVPVYYCDECGREAEFHVDGKDMCESCFFYYVRDAIRELRLTDVADLLKIKYERI